MTDCFRGYMPGVCVCLVAEECRAAKSDPTVPQTLAGWVIHYRNGLAEMSGAAKSLAESFESAYLMCHGCFLNPHREPCNGKPVECKALADDMWQVHLAALGVLARLKSDAEAQAKEANHEQD